MRLRACLAALFLTWAPLAAAAQDDLAMGQVRSAILTIDVDRLLAETRFGQRIAAEIRERSEALAAENAALADQLQAEERSLTERRPSMEVEAFRAEAEAFDERVQRIRAEQDAKQAALEDDLDEGRQAFLNAATPVLARLMIDRGAVVILERRDVFLSAGLIDVTDEAIDAVDAQLGDGLGASPPEEGVTPGDGEGAAEDGAGPQPSADEAQPAPPDSPLLSPAPGGDDGSASPAEAGATEPGSATDG